MEVSVSLKQASYKTNPVTSSPLIPVKCIKDTAAYFAERLHKAMQVRLFFVITFSS